MLALGSALTSVAAPTNPEPEPKKEMRTWLGVATSELQPALRQHLELGEGFGIQVAHIPSDSPAATAGLKAGDVLTMLDNQILTTPEHLATLIRAKKKGDAVELTYIRKGSEQKLSVTLGEHEMPVIDRHFGFPMPGMSPDQLRQWQNEMQRHHKEFNPFGRMPEPPRFDNPRGQDEGRKDRTRNESFSRNSISKSQSSVQINNDQGSVVISQNDGKGQITIRNKEGEEIYNGPYDAGRGIEGLPENARNHLKEMKVDHIDMLSTPPTPPPGEPKPEDPAPEDPPKAAEVL